MTTTDPGVRAPLRRSWQGGWIAGVAYGVSRHLGLPVGLVRALFILALLVKGSGAVLYMWLWALVPPQDAEAGGADRSVGGRDGAASGALEGLRRHRTLIVGVALIGAAVLWGLQRGGVVVPWSLVVPVGAIAAAVALTYTQLDLVAQQVSSGRETGPGPREIGVRVAIGATVMISAIFLLVVRDTDPVVVVRVLTGGLVVLVGLGIVLAPWAVLGWRRFTAERDGRVREAERADLAARLHDSVLQTLALIQRDSDRPATVVRLARAQERDLREMLYGRVRGEGGPTTLSQAVTDLVADVEDRFGVPVEQVVVGDRSLDERGWVLLEAVREALYNAVRHGAPPVRLYIECTPEDVEAFVRDRGDGFDPDAVPADRLGVRESILGRMRRHGGSAEVRSAPGDGAEVRIRLPWPTGAGASPGGGRPGGAIITDEDQDDAAPHDEAARDERRPSWRW